MITTILLDLDGTLLPMNQDEFTNGYFQFLAAKMATHGYEAKKLIASIWQGTKAMMNNDGSCTNEVAFWREFAAIYGEDSLADMCHFEEFYRHDFQKAKMFCAPNPKVAELVRLLKEKGYRLVLATSPVFPAFAVESRLGWAGLSPEDFALITAYENCTFGKPNPRYYLEIAEKLSVSPQECLMVGNDVTEDMAAEDAGMQVFLHTDYLVNKEDKDISVYPRGDFDALLERLMR